MEQKRSFVYVLYEGDRSEIEEKIVTVFEKFSRLHEKVDTSVEFATPGDPSFAKARGAYEIRKVPAFAISDVKGFSNGDPYIKVERDVLEKLESEKAIYEFTSDLHYVVIDDEVLRKKAGLALERIGGVLRALCEEVKDLIRIQVAP